MTNPTSNFGWQMPTPTDLVTDLPADFEVFGQAVDTSLADLKGGTTGQILSKATNTDMDFTWITNDVGDITAVTAGTGISGGGTSGAVTITNSMATAITTAGDLIKGTGSGTFDRLGIGSAGQVLTVAAGVPSWATPASGANAFYAGKNKIINGDFGVWQRGTTSGAINTAAAYQADRWKFGWAGTGTGTVSQQTFTPGAAPVSGYESSFFQRFAVNTVGNSTDFDIYQPIEDVRTFAGQTVTFSFWAKADSARTITVYPFQVFGTGGSAAVGLTTSSVSVTTSWARYSATIAVPSISGKTIGTNSSLNFGVRGTFASSLTLDIWGVQVEAGSSATDFQTASGSIAGELALCQRYCYVVQGNTTNTSSLGTGYWNGTTNVVGFLTSKSQMRTTPTLIYSQASDLEALQVGVSWNAVSAVALGAEANAYTAQFGVTTTGGTSGQAANVRLKALSTAYIGLVAEL